MKNILQFKYPFGKKYSKNIDILILGLGKSGLAMSVWCYAQGATVTVLDSRKKESIPQEIKKNICNLTNLGIKILYGFSDYQFLKKNDLVGISPGLSPIQEPLKTLLENWKRQKISIWSEIEFFSHAMNALKQEHQYRPSIIGITGTNGKTTTTNITRLLCEGEKKRVAAAGNIGESVLNKLSMILEKAKNIPYQLPEIWILELSSFQLRYTYSLNPDAIAILNISQDHLDWHGNMREYIKAKTHILKNANKIILNQNDQILMSISEQLDKKKIITFNNHIPIRYGCFGIYRTKKDQWISYIQKKKDIVVLKLLILTSLLRIQGQHNIENVLAALALIHSININIDNEFLFNTLKKYTGEAHRIQSIGIFDNIEYIDDSKSTNIDSTIVALKCFGDKNRKIILIMGGDGKEQDFSSLNKFVEIYVKKIILFGKDKIKISNILKKVVEIYFSNSLSEAVYIAKKNGDPGDIVLLSPACSSLDMFKNYEHRAKVFINTVHKLTTCISDIN